MKILVSIAALLGTAVAAHADAGMQLKLCVTTTLTTTIMDKTPWMKEMAEYDPTFNLVFAASLIEGMAIPDEEWAEVAAEDLSSMRDLPATMLAERWIYDAMADCNQRTS